jgi:hypothetical protein
VSRELAILLYNQMMSNPSTDHHVTLTFTRRDPKTLAYKKRTQKRYDGQIEWLESHWESGFIRIVESVIAFDFEQHHNDFRGCLCIWHHFL